MQTRPRQQLGTQSRARRGNGRWVWRDRYRDRRRRLNPVRAAKETPVGGTSVSNRAAVRSETASFAPATIANLGPGFDWLGCAVEGDGDVVVARAIEAKGVKIESIEGDSGKLSLDPTANCVGIAAQKTLQMLGAAHGVSLKLIKGLPLGSGLGSSAASAAASAHAVNSLFGDVLFKEELVLPGLEAEAAVSGYHADNIAPAILGGFVLIRGTKPLQIERLPSSETVRFALVTPKFEAPTAEMRAVLPKAVPMKSFVQNSMLSGLMMAGIYEGNAEKIGAAMAEECVIEPCRGPLIPGFAAVKSAAMEAGAYGCTISGAGPTVLAVLGPSTSARPDGAAVLNAMCTAFRESGNLQIQKAQIARLDCRGARSV